MEADWGTGAQHRERQREQERLQEVQRHERLQQELQIAAAQQLQERQRQEEQARLQAEAEHKRRAAEEQLKKSEERRRKVIRFATEAYSLYDEVRPEKDDMLSTEDAEKYLVDSLVK